MPTIQIRFDRTAIAHSDSGHFRTDGYDFNPQFVPQNTRIGEEWLAAGIGVQIRAADAYPMYAHQCFLGPGRVGLRSFRSDQFAGSFQ